MPEVRSQRAECVQQRLPPVKKDAARDPFERPRVAHVDGGFTEPQADDRGRDFRGRTERPRGEREQPLDVSRQCRLNGQRPILAASWSRGEAIGHLALEHEGRVAQPTPARRGLEQPEQDWRRDVVRKVADDTHRTRFSAKQFFEVEFQEIGEDHVHVRRRPGAERRGEVAIDFNRNDAADTGGERVGKGASSRADLEDRVVRVELQQRRESCDPRRIQEMLPEPLARTRIRPPSRP